MTPEAEVIKAVVAELESQDVPYMVVGSFATGLWGRPRSTHDVDVLIAVASDAATDFSNGFARALESQFYADADFMRDSILRRSMFNVIHFDSSFKVDVWILKDEEYEQVAFVRRVRRRFFGETGFEAFVASPEDTIFSKLRWYQQTQWERDFLDAVGVYEVQEPNLDQAYLDEWAERLGIADLLARVRREAVRPERPRS